MTQPTDGYMTVDQVAKFFAVTPYMVRKWLRANKLPAVKLNGYWRVARKDVEAYAQSLYGAS